VLHAGVMSIIGVITVVSYCVEGVVSLIGVIIFGQQFRGSSIKSPFGWSFGLMIVAFIILILNGIATIVITLTIHRRLQRAPSQFETSASADDSRMLMRKT